MIHLCDNDIVEKLAICDLLDDALAALGATLSDVYVIPTLRHRIGGKARVKAEKRLGKEVVERILSFIDDAREITQSSSNDLFILDDLIGIDAGEAVLLSATAFHPDFRLLTGDKRCLRTLASDSRCQGIAARIQGRVLCLEQVIRHLVTHFGFEHVRSKVTRHLYCDNALRSAFGSGLESTEVNCLACLQGYIAELRKLPVELLSVDF